MCERARERERERERERVCVCVCARACARARVCVCVWGCVLVVLVIVLSNAVPVSFKLPGQAGLHPQQHRRRHSVSNSCAETLGKSVFLACLHCALRLRFEVQVFQDTVFATAVARWSGRRSKPVYEGQAEAAAELNCQPRTAGAFRRPDSGHT